MDSTSVYGQELLVLEGTRGKALTTDPRDPCRQFLSCPSQRLLLGSIFVALSCLVYPPREEPSEEDRGLLSRTTAGNRA